MINIESVPFAKEEYYSGEYKNTDDEKFSFTFVDMYNENTDGDYDITWLEPILPENIQEVENEIKNYFYESKI